MRFHVRRRRSRRAAADGAPVGAQGPLGSVAAPSHMRFDPNASSGPGGPSRVRRVLVADAWRGRPGRAQPIFPVGFQRGVGLNASGQDASGHWSRGCPQPSGWPWPSCSCVRSAARHRRVTKPLIAVTVPPRQTQGHVGLTLLLVRTHSQRVCQAPSSSVVGTTRGKGRWALRTVARCPEREVG